MRRHLSLVVGAMLTLATSVSACATIVGADFDDLRVAGATFDDPKAVTDKNDAGKPGNPYTKLDSGTPDAATEAGKKKADAGTDAGADTGSAEDAAVLSGDQCDPNNPAYALAYLANPGGAPLCPCASSLDCCYQDLGCVPR